MGLRLEANLAKEWRTMEVGLGQMDGIPGQEVGFLGLVAAFIEVGAHVAALQLDVGMVHECANGENQGHLPLALPHPFGKWLSA